MGPGFFPLIVFSLLAILGASSAVSALRSDVTDEIGRWPLVPLAFVVAAPVIFALLVDRWGLLVAVVALAVVAGYRGWRRRPLEVLFIDGLLAAISVGVFIYGLALPFTVY